MCKCWTMRQQPILEKCYSTYYWGRKSGSWVRMEEAEGGDLKIKSVELEPVFLITSSREEASA